MALVFTEQIFAHYLRYRDAFSLVFEGRFVEIKGCLLRRRIPSLAHFTPTHPPNSDLHTSQSALAHFCMSSCLHLGHFGHSFVKAFCNLDTWERRRQLK
jgi:hypothetical protein